MTKKVKSKIVDPDLKERWVTALRSGDYDQGKGELKRVLYNNTCVYCCLGVLCDLVAPEGYDTVMTGIVPHTFNNKSKQQNYPNETEMRKLGLTRSMMRELADKNDSGVGFNVIADYIEETL